LLNHSWDWVGEDVTDGDQGALLAAFARAIDDAANGYAKVVEGLTATPLAGSTAYQELLQELRMAVRFLQMEAAEFGDLSKEE
jgi:hypothetical protein